METAVPTDEPPMVEQSEEDASASLSEGFGTQTVEEPSTSTEAPKEPEPAPEPEPEPPKIATITEDQLRHILDGVTEIEKVKAESTEQFKQLIGQIGGFSGFIKQLREGTAPGQSVTVTADDLEELKKDFPELADITAKGLARVLNKLKLHGSGPAPEELQRLIDTRASEIATTTLDTREKSRLARKFPTWTDIVGLPDANNVIPETPFRKWLGTKPADYKQQIEASRDAEELSDAISAFQKETKPTVRPTNSREAQLRGAIPLKSHHGGPQTPTGLTDAEQMEQGFKSELAR